MIAETGRSSGKVIRQNRLPAAGAVERGGLVELGRDVLQPAVEHDQVERDADPDVGDDHRGQRPVRRGEPVDRADARTPRSAALTTPESLLSIHDQVDADTISGSSHGTRNSARSVADSRKFRLKNTARASPMANWKTSETSGEDAACASAPARRSGLSRTVR